MFFLLFLFQYIYIYIKKGGSPWVRPSLGAAVEDLPESEAVPREENANMVRRLSSGHGDEEGSNPQQSPQDVESALSSAHGGRRKASSVLSMEKFDLDTGVRKEWLGLDRRSHRWLGISMGFFM
jgi:hypothetical protein